MLRQINLTFELAQLLNFTADVATAIRMYSAYNQSGAPSEDAPNDLMWLSDCLHHFERLGRAVQEGRPGQIILVCDDLLLIYKGYQQENKRFSRQAKPTFDRNSKLFSLDVAIAVFVEIKNKVLPMADNDVEKRNEVCV